MNTMGSKKIMVMLVLVGVLACFAQADKLELQDKLGKEVPIELKNVTIAEALERIGNETELEIVLSDEAAWKLPQGAATLISVELKGPLAQSMSKMLDAFFMRYAVGAEQITVYPRPELEHILGRPTTKQLNMLRAIYTKRLIRYNKSAQRTISEALGEDVMILPYSDTELREELDGMFRWRWLVGEPGPNEGQASFELARPVTVKHILDRIISDEFKWERWYLSGTSFDGGIPEIHVVELEQYAEAKLSQVVDLSYEPERADVILQRLAKQAGMGLRIEREDPSWLSEKISVNMQNIKLRHALENIINMVDGEMDIDEDDGGTVIRVEGPIHEEEQAVFEPGRSDRILVGGDYVGKISIPMDGGKYFIEFMLRESDLTEELRKLREEKVEQILGRPSKPKPRRRAAISKPAAAAREKRSAGQSE